MNLFKFLLVVFLLALAIVGGIALFGVLAALFKWVVILGIITLAGVGAYKLLTKSREPHLELSPAEAEMMKAERLLAEIRSKQLMK